MVRRGGGGSVGRQLSGAAVTCSSSGAGDITQSRRINQGQRLPSATNTDLIIGGTGGSDPSVTVSLVVEGGNTILKNN